MAKAFSTVSDPVTRVAAWVTPASNAAADDPVLDLLAERKRLDELAKRAYDEAIELEATLPAHIQRGWVPVTLDARLWPGGNGMPSYFGDEDLICLNFSPRAARGDVDPEYLAEQKAKALEQFRAGKAKIQEAREASGCTALEREVKELGFQEDAVFNQLKSTKPKTMAGVIAMLELAAADLENRENEIELLEPALAGLREIAAKLPVLAPKD